MMSKSERFFCLLDELQTSHKLICAGFGCLQEIDFANDFYHLPHQLLASGLERLMKSYISLVYQDQNGIFPDMSFMKKLGHDLENLQKIFCTQYYGGFTRPLIKCEYDFLMNDNTLKNEIRILSQFGRYGRYYNLDVVAGSPYSPIDPKGEWEKLEQSIEDPTPFLNDSEALYRDYYPRVHSKLISKLERLVRAIALQFAVGNHNDQFGNLRTTSIVFTDFRNLKDKQLGTVDYRQSVRILKQEMKSWIKYNKQEILGGQWPTRIVTKKEFGDTWPFRSDQVIVELRESLFAIAYIEGYAFALNGSAASRFNMPFPHDAGIAILGKSVGPFIEMAFSLQNN